jgi:hypothetical protein
MHNLNPKSRYKIITLQIASPEKYDEAEITDALNDLLRDACNMPDSVVADWRFHQEFPQITRTGRAPVEEGEAFNQAVWPK